MSRVVPFFDYPKLSKEYGPEVRERMDAILDKGAFILQTDVDELEAKICKYLGCKHAITVANGTDGLLLAMRAAGIKEGDEVIMPSHTYIATAAAAHFTGGTIKLVEIGDDHMMDPDAFEAAITEKTKFVMPVHVNGRTCNMDRIVEIANKHNITIIEDAAQALGSKYNGKNAGTIGLAGMFSFYPAKVLGCFGDGGVVVTNDDKMAEELYLLRDHGRNENGDMVTWGFNSRLDNLHAGVLSVKMDHYPEIVERRRHIAALYNEGLKDVEQLTLPPGPDQDPNHFDVYQNYELEAQNRDELKSFLSDRKIGTIVQWAGKAVHMHEKLGLTHFDLKKTETMTNNFLMLPMNNFVSDEDVQYVIDSVKEFYSK